MFGLNPFRSTISRRPSRLMDRTFPIENLVHPELADLLVESGDQGGLPFLPFVLFSVEDASRSLQEGFLPGRDLTGVGLVLDG